MNHMETADDVYWTAAQIGGTDFVEAWVCPQPAPGVPYRVLRDKWIENYTVRLILEVKSVNL